jgi:hypothetical protein
MNEKNDGIFRINCRQNLWCLDDRDQAKYAYDHKPCQHYRAEYPADISGATILKNIQQYQQDQRNRQDGVIIYWRDCFQPLNSTEN